MSHKGHARCGRYPGIYLDMHRPPLPPSEFSVVREITLSVMSQISTTVVPK